MRRDQPRHLGGEPVPIDRQRRAGRHPAGVGRAHHHRAEPPHLFLEQPDGVIELVAAERVAAHQLGELVGLVHVGAAHRPHLVDDHRDAERGRLPRRLAAGQTAADDVDACQHLGRRSASGLPAFRCSALRRARRCDSLTPDAQHSAARARRHCRSDLVRTGRRRPATTRPWSSSSIRRGSSRGPCDPGQRNQLVEPVELAWLHPRQQRVASRAAPGAAPACRAAAASPAPRGCRRPTRRPWRRP